MSKMFRFIGLIFVAGIGMAGAQNLGPLAASRGKRLGAAITFPAGTSLAPYDSTITQQLNTEVCENAMKFAQTEPNRNQFSFTASDSIFHFAQSHGLYMRGHNFIWWDYNPSWLSTKSYQNRDTMLAIMRNHITNVAGHYKGQIYEWDVVNEAIDPTQANGFRKSVWDTTIGNDFIDSAFVIAHRVDPNAWLVYNDYAGESDSGSSKAKSDLIYQLVSGLLNRGIPINGVGLQCHLDSTEWDTAAIGSNMSRLEALGLNISITEMDDPLPANPDSAWLYRQKSDYQSMMALCLRHPGCKTFITWGVNDNQSWLGASAAPLLYTGTTTIVMKPAYYGVQTALLAAAVSSNPLPLPAGGTAAIWQVNSDRPGILQQQFQPRGFIQNGVPQFNVRGSVYNLQGRQIPALAIPKNP